MQMPERADRAGSRAVLIGVAAYQDRRFPAIPAAGNSLRGMHRMLVDDQLGGWSYDQVTVIDDPVDCRRLARDLRRLAHDTTGALLCYFVGHGTLSPNGELILALADSDADDPDITGLEYSRVRDALLDSPAKVKIAVLDCCYSGRVIDMLAGGADDLADSIEVQGAYTLTAADRAAHAGKPDGHTEFTGHLLDLVRTGLPNGRPVLTFADLYPHLRQRLAASSLPRPNQRGTDTAQHYPVARNAHYQASATDHHGTPRRDPPAEQPTTAPAENPAAPAPLVLDRRNPWPATLLTLTLIYVVGTGQAIWENGSAGWSMPKLLTLGLAALAMPLLIAGVVKRDLARSGPLVIDSRGLRWRRAGRDYEVRWEAIRRVQLIGAGRSATLAVWLQPGLQLPVPAGLRSTKAPRAQRDGYPLMKPALLYGKEPAAAVNTRIKQSLAQFAADKYAY